MATKAKTTKGKKAKPSDKLTEKQEAFSLAYMETGNAAEAYRRAYDVDPNARDSWLYVEATQLLDNPKIALRVKELQEQAARLSMYTMKSAFEEYEQARILAITKENPSAAISAVTGKVKLFGLDSPQKLALTDPEGKPVEPAATDSELARAMAVLLSKGLASGGN